MKSNLVLPASIIFAALILAYSVSTLNNTLRCTSVYGLDIAVLATLSEQYSPKRRRLVEAVSASGCKDKWEEGK